ncbi:hypothetical protein M8C21_001671 [Ambrosia artemisiifolia]|uniref:Uncharacterized protein n=1 Tax=Ambrosia artemisiifolia TaxID=4212 RepID=A0AAD5BNJ7_AMBAR|nr:hypothetical protein M8C21_001671 [Ambrosia artemisiifolia]
MSKIKIYSEKSGPKNFKTRGSAPLTKKDHLILCVGMYARREYNHKKGTTISKAERNKDGEICVLELVMLEV